MSKPVATIIREHGLLRDIAIAAIRLRNIGKALDSFEETQNALVKEYQGTISRSLTPALMYQQAYDTALSAFDKAVMDAAAANLDILANYENGLSIACESEVTDGG